MDAVTPADQLKTMNNRPSLGSASEITNEVLAYLGQNKVILDLGHAEEAAGLRARGRSALEAADKERKTTTENWREATKAENAIYKTVLDPLKAALEKLTDLVANYVRAEESVRAAQAERLRVESSTKAQAAQDAEKKADESGDTNARADALAAKRIADDATLEAARAESTAKVSIDPVGGGKTIKMRTVENIKVIDACAAIKAMSVDGVLPDRIAEAIALEAKDYRKRFGKLPPGTMATCERVL